MAADRSDATTESPPTLGVRVRTWAALVRGTPDDAPKVRRLLDELAVRDDVPYAVYAWAEEVTRLVEGRD